MLIMQPLQSIALMAVLMGLVFTGMYIYDCLRKN